MSALTVASIRQLWSKQLVYWLPLISEALLKGKAVNVIIDGITQLILDDIDDAIDEVAIIFEGIFDRLDRLFDWQEYGDSAVFVWLEKHDDLGDLIKRQEAAQRLKKVVLTLKALIAADIERVRGKEPAEAKRIAILSKMGGSGRAADFFLRAQLSPELITRPDTDANTDAATVTNQREAALLRDKQRLERQVEQLQQQLAEAQQRREDLSVDGPVIDIELEEDALQLSEQDRQAGAENPGGETGETGDQTSETLSGPPSVGELKPPSALTDAPERPPIKRTERQRGHGAVRPAGKPKHKLQRAR